ncbi:MAG: pteridine reductase [Gammaproteobacteria bacterium]
MTTSLEGKVVLITGAARRVGSVIARCLHQEGVRLALHYNQSESDAQELQQELNAARPDSVVLIQCNILQEKMLSTMINNAIKAWGRLDILINNASTFYPTQIGSVTSAQWEDLMGSNLKAPFFLSQAAVPYLRQTNGCIVNIVDIHGTKPLKSHPVYSIAKAGLVMLTKSLARELGPEIRVNAVAPGAILWPENDIDEVTKQRIISRTLLKRQGTPDDIARAILFLIRDADYVSGEIITVDGGRGLN